MFAVLKTSAVVLTGVKADPASMEAILKDFNLKENAKEMLGGLKIDAATLQKQLASGGQDLAKEFGFQNGFNAKEMDATARQYLQPLGLDSYLTKFENGMDPNLVQEGKQIWQHMQQAAGKDGLGAAVKNGVSEAVAMGQHNEQVRDTFNQLKHLKQQGVKGLGMEALNAAAHTPQIEQMLESNGFHVNDLLTRLGGGDSTGKAGLEKMMDMHREQVESNFDEEHSHFSYFFTFVIFVVLCAIAVFLHEIYALHQKKRKGPIACENMV